VPVKSHFESLFSTSQEPSPEDQARAMFVREHIPATVNTILEVGCGSGTVTRVLAEDRKVTGLELTFAGTHKVRDMGISCVQGSIDSLPFENDSFDLVLASEVLEHLNDEIFSGGLREMTRAVSRYVMVTVPNHERLQLVRRECPRCRTIVVPWTHIRSFDIDMLEHLFDPIGFAAKEVGPFGPRDVYGQSFLTRLLMLYRRVFRGMYPGVTCPICLHTVKGKAPHGIPGWRDLLSQPKVEILHLLDFIACRLSPKHSRWLFALYERRG